MQVVWKLCLAHIRHNKIKNLLVALLILLAALLLGAASVVLANSGNVFGKMHEQTNGSHQLLTLDQHIHDPQRVHAWWAAQSGVQVSKLERFRALSGLAYKGADIPNQYLMLMEKTQAPAGVDELIFAQGEQQAEPANGTVWIPTSLAYTQGIAAGDSISIKAGAEQLELQVAAIVIDVPYGAPFSNTARIWINAQDYAAHISTLAGEDAYVMGLRFDDYSQMPSYWQRFEQEWGTPYLESRTEFSEISSFYLIINQIVGFVLIFLGSIMMLIALLTVGFAISDAISANYRTIGILKASGMTSGRITEVYTLQYAGLSLAAIIPGTAISWYISGFFIDLSMSTLKPEGGTLPVQGLSFAALVGLLLWLLITLFAMFYAGQTRSIQPVQAIRYGMSEQASSRSASRMRGSLVNRLGFGRLPLAAVIGLRSAASNRKGSILTLILSTLAASVLVLGVVMLSSIGGIRHTAPQWGYDNSHIAAIVVNPATFSHAAFAQALGDDPRIINFGWQGNISGIIPSRSASAAQPDGSTTLSIYISVLDGSYEELGFKTLTGVDPVQRNEISIGVNIARELGKRIGDTIDVYIDGEKQTFLITGIYQAIANMSYSARLTVDAVKTINPAFAHYDAAFINVQEPAAQAEAVALALQEQFKQSASVMTQQSLLDSVFKQATAIMVYPFSFIGLLFLAVSCIIVYSTCRISLRHESRTYGIYKSLGLTSRRIRLAIALGIALLATLGALLGIAIGVYSLPLLLERVLGSYGIVQMPLVLDWSSIMLASLASVAAAVLASWIASAPLRQTSPRILVTDT